MSNFGCVDLGLTTGISMVSTLPNIINKPKGNWRPSVCRRPDPAKHYDAPEYEDAESSVNKGRSVYSCFLYTSIPPSAIVVDNANERKKSISNNAHAPKKSTVQHFLEGKNVEAKTP